VQTSNFEVSADILGPIEKKEPSKKARNTKEATQRTRELLGPLKAIEKKRERVGLKERGKEKGQGNVWVKNSEVGGGKRMDKEHGLTQHIRPREETRKDVCNRNIIPRKKDKDKKRTREGKIIGPQ